MIQTRLRSEQPPDYFGYDTGPGFGGVLADAGLLYPLDKAYKENGWKIYDWAKQRATYGGKTYGVPSQVEELIVYYNKDLVPEVPKTVDDLRALADDLKGQDKTAFGFGDSEQWPAGHLYSIGISNLLGREGLDDILYGDGRWDTPEVEAAIDLFFRDFVENGYYPEGVNAITYDDANNLFYAGEAAMNTTGTWLVSDDRGDRPGLRGRVLPVPVHRRLGHLAAGRGGGGSFRSRGSQESRGRHRVHDFYQQEDTARTIMETAQHDPGPPGQHRGSRLPELFKQVLADLSESTEAGSFGYNIDVLTPQNFNEVMFSGFQEVLNGTRSAARAGRGAAGGLGEGQEAGQDRRRRSRKGAGVQARIEGEAARAAPRKAGLRRSGISTCRRCAASKLYYAIAFMARPRWRSTWSSCSTRSSTRSTSASPTGTVSRPKRTSSGSRTTRG